MENLDAKFVAESVDNLKTQSVRGSSISFAAQGIKFATQLAATVVLSRLLAPAEFGAFALVLSVIIFISIFKDGGLTVAVVQSRTLSETQSATLFRLNVCLGFVLALASLAAVWLTARIYQNEQLFAVGSLLSVNFLLIGFYAQPLGLLRRRMQFAAIAKIEMAAGLFGAVAGITTAWFGGGVWSLAIVSVATELTLTIAYLRLVKPGFDFRFNFYESIQLLSFGGYLTAFELLAYLNFNFDNLLVAWFWGVSALGFYDKAYQLLLIPLNQLSFPLGNVVHATLSRVQHEPQRFRQYFYRYVLLLASIGMPLVVLLFDSSENLIAFLLGEQWLPSAQLFQAFAPAAFMMSVTPAIGWLFVSLGRVKRQLYWHSAMTCGWLVVLFVAVQTSVLTAAWALSAMRAITFLPTLIFAAHGTPISWTRVLLTVARPASAAVGALIILRGARLFLPQSDWYLWNILVNSTFYVIVYLAVWLLLPNGFKLFKENLQLLKSAFSS